MKRVEYTTYGPPEVLRIEEVEKPVPGDREVLIRIRASSVTAVDCIFRRGDSFFARTATGLTRPRISTSGTALAGEIESTGREVTLFKAGDRVFGESDTGHGAHAEYVCLPENDTLAIKPSNMNFEEAAAIPYGALTALPFLRDSGHIRRGHKVLVIGASGAVGTCAIQLARHFEAEVTGVCSTANVALVKSLGAHRVIDYTKDDFTGSGETWDIIFDTVGKSSFPRCKRALTRNGIYLTTVVGLPILFHMLWTSKIGSQKAVIAFTGLRPAGERAKDLRFLKELVEAGTLRPVIDRRYPLEQIVEAHRYVDQGHKKGNVVITVGDDTGSGV